MYIKAQETFLLSLLEFPAVTRVLANILRNGTVSVMLQCSCTLYFPDGLRYHVLSSLSPYCQISLKLCLNVG